MSRGILVAVSGLALCAACSSSGGGTSPPQRSGPSGKEAKLLSDLKNADGRFFSHVGDQQLSRLATEVCTDFANDPTGETAISDVARGLGLANPNGKKVGHVAVFIREATKNVCPKYAK